MGPTSRLLRSPRNLKQRNVDRAASVLDSILRVLVSHSFLTCSKTEHGLRYGIAPKGKFFVADERGVSMAPFFALTLQQESANWGISFKDMVLEGRALCENAQRHYANFASNSDANKIFNNAMQCVSTLTMKQILKIYNGFDGMHSLVDVGGGNGATLDMIISKYTSIKGINLDLPTVIQTAPTYKGMNIYMCVFVCVCKEKSTYWPSNHRLYLAGVEHVAGDMFAELPKADAIMLKKGKVIVIEHILPEIPQTDVYSRASSLQNILMLLINGRERTKVEYEAMTKEAGFDELRVVCHAFGAYVMELVKF
ncbi:caffeic acid 3-O-methyltransferase 1-like [Dorcoceras hygrometricum]|uniref:Caffeic acid 3-O-methyltransferase 1-like n=1 Tax=Dorcoceras hygrometricum TaxID=472368 RepID=A0A2Z7AEW0_9LAMI|nr:caffeic acid 3-O-methyltransferase 1-like [Dorcoceras hygrometricum]